MPSFALTAVVVSSPATSFRNSGTLLMGPIEWSRMLHVFQLVPECSQGGGQGDKEEDRRASERRHVLVTRACTSSAEALTACQENLIELHLAKRLGEAPFSQLCLHAMLAHIDSSEEFFLAARGGRIYM